MNVVHNTMLNCLTFLLFLMVSYHLGHVVDADNEQELHEEESHVRKDGVEEGGFGAPLRFPVEEALVLRSEHVESSSSDDLVDVQHTQEYVENLVTMTEEIERSWPEPLRNALPVEDGATDE